EAVRGEFKPVATTVPGLKVCEHLPRMARVMPKVALVRSMTHAATLHDSASIHALTGRPLDGADRELFSPLPQFYPSYGRAVAAGEGGGGGNGAEMGHARHMRGQNLLLARRLVEAGVPFVTVYDFRQQGQNWDAHFKGANQHKTHLLPQADQSLSALIEDLD